MKNLLNGNSVSFLLFYFYHFFIFMKSILEASISFFSAFDLFQVFPTFYIEKSPAYKTPFGASVSCIIIAFILFQSVSLIADLALEASPLIKIKDQEVSREDVHKFDSSDFIFGVALRTNDGKNIPLDDGGKTYFSISFIQCQHTFGRKNCSVLNATPCKLHPYFSSNTYISQDSWAFNLLADGQCIDTSNDSKRSLRSSFQHGDYENILIQVSQCRNQTTCAPQSEISQLLQDATLYYSYQQSKYDPTKAATLSKEIQIDYTQLGVTQKNVRKIYYQYAISSTDHSVWFFDSSIDQDQQIIFDKEIEEVYYKDEGSETLAEFKLELSNTKRIYSRSYNSVFDIIAKIGGLFSMLRNLFSLIMLPLKQLEMKLYILKKLQENDGTQSMKSSARMLLNYITDDYTRSLNKSQMDIMQRYLNIIDILKRPLKPPSRSSQLRGRLNQVHPGQIIEQQNIFQTQPRKEDGALRPEQMNLPNSVIQQLRRKSQLKRSSSLQEQEERLESEDEVYEP